MTESFGCTARAEAIPDRPDHVLVPVTNARRYVVVPRSALPRLRYHDIYQNKGGKLVVQNVMGERKALDRVIPGWVLHVEPPIDLSP